MNTILCALLLAQSPAPILQAEPAAVDRGDVKSGSMLAQEFTLRHLGKGVISITDVRVGCGCLRPRLSTKSLAPGESAKLTFEVNTLSQAAGANTWKATIRYRAELREDASQPETGEIEVSIRANVIREIQVDPVGLVLSGEGELTHTITLTDRRERPLTVAGAKCELKHVKVQPYQPTVDANGLRIQRIRVTVLDSLPAGHFSDTIRLQSNDPDYREIAVPIQISRRAKGEVIAAPDRMSFRLAKEQSVVSGLIRLRDPDDNPVVIEKMEADSPNIQFKSAPGPGSMATVRVSIDLTKDRKSGSGTLTIHLREPKTQAVVIPVSWLIP